MRTSTDNTVKFISVENRSTEQSSNFLDPLLKPLNNPMMLFYLALAIILLILKSSSEDKKGVLANARFATPREVSRGRRIGLEQIKKGSLKRTAIELENLILSDIQPAVATAGKSGTGKTRSIGDPALKNAIDRGWSNLVFDVKGELIEKHAAYALSQGYEVYIYAPGFPYSDGLNFLKFMKDENDAKTAEEIAQVIEANFGKPGDKKDGFFSPQGVTLLKLVFMMAKASPFEDLLSAWKILSLPELAKRLKIAEEYDCFEDLGLSIWIKEAATALRSLAESGRTIDSIIATSMTNFQRMVDQSIIPCLINHTIPLDLTGKQIVFFQLDENAKSATAPLVAAAIHLLVTRNLNASVKRKNILGLFLDEFDSILLPDIKDYITKMRSYGLIAFLSYQSESQVIFKYTRPYADSLLSSCGTKIYFATGDSGTAQRLSDSLGKKEVKHETGSRTYGTKTTRSVNEHVQTAPLITADEINQQQQGEAVIVDSPGFKSRPYKTKIRIEPKNDILWEQCSDVWFRKIKPHREQKIAAISGDAATAVINREVLAGCTLPAVEEIETMQTT